MRAQPYVCLGGTELANGDRVLTYAPQALECLDWCFYLGPDTTCDVLLDAGYSTVAGDPAPWFDPSVAVSQEFLGLFANVTVDSVVRRASTDLVEGGASVGRLRNKPRVVAVSGIMFATTQGGLWYGQRWMEEVLAGGCCQDGCAADELEILPYCDEGAFRRLLRVGVADGPTFTEFPGEHDFTAQQFALQLVAGVPYLFSRPSTVVDETLEAGGIVCGQVDAATWSDAVVRVQVTASDDGPLEDVTVTMTPTAGDCPTDELPSDYAPVITLAIPRLEASSRLTIDGRTGDVTVRLPSSGREVSGRYLLDVAGRFSWPSVPPCTSMCVCVFNGSQEANVLVEAYSREL